MRLLLADNDIEFLQVRAECLRNAGYDVVLATTEEEARTAFRNCSCDLVIVDVRLKDDNDEKDKTGLLLAMELASETPKIILTGYPSPDLVAEVLRQRPDVGQLAWDFVAKEEDPERLLEAVRKVSVALAM